MVLFLSAEPYVPWELAVVDPPLDPDLPPFLAVQATVGRWVLGQRRPRLPPPASVPAARVAVVSGVYDLPGWSRLEEAEAEATDLVERYGATAVNATAAEVLDVLRGSPSADLIHFACHGTFDGEGGPGGLILVDGTALDPLAVRGTPFSGTPFVFLNACQVGRGNELLGDHAGMAEAFLYAGAAGVIAPLWSIDDRLARQIALRFYERALRGETAGEILRSERAAFRDSPDTVSSTYLAYQYFGHPALRLGSEPPPAAMDAAASLGTAV
jgi:CHAT domain-containing protein